MHVVYCMHAKICGQNCVQKKKSGTRLQYPIARVTTMSENDLKAFVHKFRDNYIHAKPSGASRHLLYNAHIKKT